MVGIIDCLGCKITRCNYCGAKLLPFWDDKKFHLCTSCNTSGASEENVDTGLDWIDESEEEQAA